MHFASELRAYGAQRILPQEAALDRLQSLVAAEYGMLVTLEGGAGIHYENPIYREIYGEDGPARLDFTAYWRRKPLISPKPTRRSAGSRSLERRIDQVTSMSGLCGNERLINFDSRRRAADRRWLRRGMIAHLRAAHPSISAVTCAATERASPSRS